jgi:hypothetical protein
MIVRLSGFDSERSFLWRQHGETQQLVVILRFDKTNSLIFLRVSVGQLVATACLGDQGLDFPQIPIRNEIVAGVFERFSPSISIWFDSFQAGSDISKSCFFKKTYVNVEAFVNGIHLPEPASVENIAPANARVSAFELSNQSMFDSLRSEGFLVEHILVLRTEIVRFVRQRSEVYDVIEIISSFDRLAFSLKPFFWTCRLETPPERRLPKFPKSIDLVRDTETIGREFLVFPASAFHRTEIIIRELLEKLLSWFAEVNCVADIAKQIVLDDEDLQKMSENWQLVRRLSTPTS